MPFTPFQIGSFIYFKGLRERLTANVDRRFYCFCCPINLAKSLFIFICLNGLIYEYPSDQYR